MWLYLKYRPQDFDNLVWQDFVNTTLKKAIADNNTVGAYLLCGPRWTGKTSTARILAKAINCNDIKQWNPCLTCSTCKDFLEEKLIDIIEIDAASHTWVENIREIIEKAQFRPSLLKYKVYIIDEVHMLSTGAFNALLKILEEPPEYVKFILATTETHKVPETIVSRCQKYDFKRISSSDIIDRLQYIASQESIAMDEESAQYIAANSAGWLRDAISLFEQLIADKAISYERVVSQLGLVWQDILENFYKKLQSQDTTVVKDFQAMIADGKNIKLFFKELIFFIQWSLVEQLWSWNSIWANIGLLDTLHETYNKTKHSFDEQTTLLIGLFKILEPQELKVTSKAPVKTSSHQAVAVAQVDTKVQDTSTAITHDDIGDIFQDVVIDAKPEAAIGDFDINLFLETLKKNGAKWSLTMGIRAWSAGIVWNDLIITFKTEFARKAADTSDNTTLIYWALKDMWIEVGEVKCKI